MAYAQTGKGENVILNPDKKKGETIKLDMLIARMPG